MAANHEAGVYSQERERMVARQLRGRGIRDERVLAAMARVARQEFVPSSFRDQAYEDHPLPIGEEQTISQPYIVALMLEHLAIAPHHKILEIGTGSGYQTALLAEMAAWVYSMERHPSLAESATAVLKHLRYSNCTVVVGNGSQGLREHSPFDRIIVSAAAVTIPEALFTQLGEGGRMILPVGAPDAQELQLVQKKEGRPVVQSLEGCRFVPLITNPA